MIGNAPQQKGSLRKVAPSAYALRVCYQTVIPVISTILLARLNFGIRAS
jgi:hypothetical protein